jgi:hypothetical protein
VGGKSTDFRESNPKPKKANPLFFSLDNKNKIEKTCKMPLHVKIPVYKKFFFFLHSCFPFFMTVVVVVVLVLLLCFFFFNKRKKKKEFHFSCLIMGNLLVLKIFRVFSSHFRHCWRMFGIDNNQKRVPDKQKTTSRIERDIKII